MAKRSITKELKEQILEITTKLSTYNYYTILGLNSNATPQEIKRAYFSLSKVYHPDSYYGEDLGDLKSHLETLFMSITRAYDVLSNPETRVKYDSYLKKKDELSGIVSNAENSIEEVKRHIMQKTGVMPAISMPGQSVNQVESNATTQTHQASGIDKAKIELSSRIHSEWKKQRILKYISPEKAVQHKRREMVDDTIGEKIKNLIVNAEVAEKEGNIIGAIGAFKLAISLNPGNKEIQEKFDLLLKRISPFLGERYFTMGKMEEELGEKEKAIESFQKAVNCSPQNPEFRYKLALALFEYGGDLRRAYNEIKTAESLSSSEVIYQLLYAKICIKAGLKRQAEKLLQNCMKHESVKKEAKELLEML